ncbi:GT4 family glycosyltransferase PelF [Pandoraea nosoerga]|uniref:Glycosyl transferase family 1 n=1 Tax=Pandoraea nosoerga TaxID=2508296 RepID=A0A5E4XZ37_9BURK|nr:GT4 family glycosyltransferase PelF [Pandoraea nosoerga]MBN4666479.1 GT4 family glycosyltransferase PelF [Pandoraea nosoerga]MBN4677504.1 GT4 family glycosyltransferase PelF [Pandoraea nosoerga]MBN4682324.1 GT4 family glycosyltransferase PelF [Pandoraea nosoerga]MBN4745639.1 GT4 family glycosyltransferase PelF [Pandoraea nosoerga]VVE41731.1 glycosyl transferase family 1 [Pandoraea nosoerga]
MTTPGDFAPAPPGSDRVASAVVADVALLLEGTFPYVRGGVSSWVDQLIRAFPELTFAVVFIGSRRDDYGEPVYAMPPNVAHFEAHYLYETPAPSASSAPSASAPGRPSRTRPKSGEAPAFADVARMHDMFRRRHASGADGGASLREPSTGADDTVRDLLSRLVPQLQDGQPLAQAAFLHGESAWGFITERYERHCHDPSFTDYFWTVRAMHRPIWQLARLAHALPAARMYHTVSTGYAGLLGAMLRMRSGRPLLVTEHGSYTKERKLDLLQSEWLRDNRGPFERDISQVGYFQNLWMRFFEAIGRVCYDAADEIVALYEGNRRRQVSDGAPVGKTRVIPNGVDVARFAALRRPSPPCAGDADIPPVVALVGRVVPVKDIKTFLRAVFIAYRARPDVQAWIVGPDTEDPAYAQECRDLAASLGMEFQVRFMGYRAVESVLPQIGVLALSSVSEALPLVMLEAAAAGVPVVATDVGACRQVIEGQGAEDRALGRAGRVVPMADPEALAAAIVDVLEPAEWHAARQAGMTRVARYYRLDMMCDAYRSLYQGLCCRRMAGSAD